MEWNESIRVFPSTVSCGNKIYWFTSTEHDNIWLNLKWCIFCFHHRSTPLTLLKITEIFHSIEIVSIKLNELHETTISCCTFFLCICKRLQSNIVEFRFDFSRFFFTKLHIDKSPSTWIYLCKNAFLCWRNTFLAHRAGENDPDWKAFEKKMEEIKIGKKGEKSHGKSFIVKNSAKSLALKKKLCSCNQAKKSAYWKKCGGVCSLFHT